MINQEAEKFERIIERLSEEQAFSGTDIYTDRQLHTAIIEEIGTDMKKRIWAIEQLKNKGMIISNGLTMWKIEYEL